MPQEIKCEKCNQLMFQIGPYASTQEEGKPAQKWDGRIDYQCVNEDCADYLVIVTK